MKKISTLLSVVLSISPAFGFAKSTGTNTTKSTVKAPAPEESAIKVSSSFGFGIGSDSNIFPDKAGQDGTFYQIAPALSITGKELAAKLSASLKDYSEQEISDKAKTTEAGAEFSLNTKLIGQTKSTTTLGFLYHDEMWPDYINDTQGGMPIRFVHSALAQRLAWDFGRLNVALDGSIAFRDFSSQYTDWAAEIYGQQYFQNDYRETAGSARFGVKMTDSVEIAATPTIRHRLYEDRPSRQTNGINGGVGASNGELEWIDSEITAELGLSFGSVKIVPAVISGVRSDQVNGAEDYTMNGASLAADITFDPKTNFKVSGKIGYKNIRYDNWSSAVTDGNRRIDDETSSSIAASVNLTKNLILAFNYENILEESTMVEVTDENYRQEIISSTLTASF